jgi:hypothetical protein
MVPARDIAHDCTRVHALAALLAGAALDAALEAGLMDLQLDPHCPGCGEDARRVAAEQTRLRRNWAARERYRARAARLQRRAAERQARRAPPVVATEARAVAPALPPAVAAALARAQARAAGRSDS